MIRHGREVTGAMTQPDDGLISAEVEGDVLERFQFHVLSFEGPDPYARAGGLASRISGLTEALAAAGHETHLWFVGSPYSAGHEANPPLHLHRWCQWISRFHPGGVYDGEDGKHLDYSSSLPPYLVNEVLLPHLRAGDGRAVVLAEEWHTVDAVLHLDALLRQNGVRERVALLWNANNIFGFHRIDWGRLTHAAAVTTVSRYMRQQMWGLGLDPMVIPNGLTEDALGLPSRRALHEFHRRTRGRFVLAKVGRYDPDKRWLLAVDTTALLRDIGWRPLLIARGGVEPHGAEVMARAAGHALRVVEHPIAEALDPVVGLLETLSGLEDMDVLSLQRPLVPDSRKLLFRGAAAVLANSGHEPFGLVGLEAMAAGGIACLGGTGEDYAIPGWNSLMLQSEDPREFVEAYARMRPADVRAMRHHGLLTARRSVWSEVIKRNLLPQVELVLSRQASRPPARRAPHSPGTRRAPRDARRRQPPPAFRPPPAQRAEGGDVTFPAEPRPGT
jgi:glycosyltransferase involved in cell wall biosynthesis